MARPESVIKAGFYPTPEHLLGPIFGRLILRGGGRDASLTICDPCAGEGVALQALRSRMQACPTANGVGRTAIHTFAVELEANRYAKLQQHFRSALHGDAFQVLAPITPGKQGADVLYLNPPYDVDAEHKRLEERWLARWAPRIVVGGLLIFVVPHYALAASAATLALHFEDVTCTRFPDADFEPYKQVVVYARRRAARPYPDPALQELVLGWADAPESLPVLGEAVAPIEVRVGERSGFESFTLAGLDLDGLLAAAQPWTTRGRGGDRLDRACTPELDEADLLTRRYPLASPPRAAHMAAALAAGVFNGARVSADQSGAGPDLLVKGTFTRDWRRVEEKHNKDGQVVAHIEVQQPKLCTTVLDLATGLIHTLTPTGDLTGTTDPAAMTTADLLAGYGRGLMAAMLAACPVLRPALPDFSALLRQPYPAQQEAVAVVAHLLRHGDAAEGLRTGAIVQGQVGTGKTTVALATMHELGARNPLVLVPPHLVSTWSEQAREVLPGVDVRVLRSVSDVQALPRGTAARPVLAILSREAAKLGHGYEGVTGSCPGCGSSLPARDFARLRERCEVRPSAPANDAARWLLELVDVAAPVVPGDPSVARLYPRTPARARALKSWLDKRGGQAPALEPTLRALAERVLPLYQRHVAVAQGRRGYMGTWKPDVWARLDAAGVLDAASPDREAQWLAVSAAHNEAIGDLYRMVLTWLTVALPDLFDRVAPLLADDEGWADYNRRPCTLLADLVMLRRPDEAELRALAIRLERDHNRYGHDNPWRYLPDRRKVLAGELPFDPMKHSKDAVVWGEVTSYHKVAVGSPEATMRVLDALAGAAAWKVGEPCAAPLYCAVPEPRRYPLATWITHRSRGLFDMLVIDEGHEYATAGSAQQVAAERLTTLRVPTLLLSGTLSNGYARSLFTSLHALSARFRRLYDRDDGARFVDRYGYLKRSVSHVDGKGKVVAFGAQSDRYTVQERAAGQAPGVLPLLQLQWLGPMAVTLQLDDLGVDLPPCELLPVELPLDGPVGAGATHLFTKVREAVRRDRFKEGLSGKLWGAVARLPSYPDLASADTGNAGDDGARTYEVRYPDAVGGELVAVGATRPADELLAKESWIVDRVRAELDEGRPVLVYALATVLLPRLARLLREGLGCPVAVLNPDKVGTDKRDDWIRREVVGKGVRVLVTNAACVQTGLNSLVAFPTIVWAQNPECNPTVYAQANGRIHRVGQTRATRVWFPMYRGLQVQAHKLLLHKVGVARAVDGLDPEAALRAAGIIDEESFGGFSVGRALYEMVTRGAA